MVARQPRDAEEHLQLVVVRGETSGVWPSPPVMQDDQLIVRIDAGNIGEFLMIQSALRRK